MGNSRSEERSWRVLENAASGMRLLFGLLRGLEYKTMSVAWLCGGAGRATIDI
jgi:hypothetical protein